MLCDKVANGAVRKVLVKKDVNLSQATSHSHVLHHMQVALESLIPYYDATR
ncbi:hypothetical protein STRDD10_00942 [Streptococcus sp. DD10]|nr:hypothetical protein STRDD10_00942 [Streptococcus sp. DD10]